jgi:hypothetical protein
MQVVWVLGATTQEGAAGAAINRLLTAHKAEAFSVEFLGAIDVFDKKADRANLGDLEWARQQNSFDIVGRGKALLRAVA